MEVTDEVLIGAFITTQLASMVQAANAAGDTRMALVFQLNLDTAAAKLADLIEHPVPELEELTQVVIEARRIVTENFRRLDELLDEVARGA
jgi:hypothetical protein